MIRSVVLSMKSTQFHTFKNIMNFLRNWRKPNEFFKRMKKQYLLALIAAPFFCAASVNAQSNKPLLKGGNEVVAGLSLNSIQTKAETNALPDSMIIEQNGAVTNKNIYKYDDAGRKTEQIDYANTPLVPVYKHLYEYGEKGELSKINTTYWDGTQWIPLCVENYTYDEQGRQTRYDYDGVTIEGVSEKRHIVHLTKYEGNKSITIQEDTTWRKEPNEYYVANKETFTQILDDRENIISEEQFSNVYGYTSLKQEMTYDENNRLIKQLSVYYNADGSVDIKYRETFTYDDQYEHQLMEISEGEEDNWQFLLETGTEIIEGNPKVIICSENLKGEGEPMVEWKKTSYYYPNSSTANESIESEAAVRIYTQEGSIVVNTENAEPVAVYSITGKCYYNATATGMTTINNLQAGIYIVRVGDKTLKVRVR